MTAAFVAAGAPTALSALTGSGQLVDAVQLTTQTGSIAGSSLSTSGTPVSSGTPYSVHNSGSNVDTYVRYDWSTTPYYGSSSGDTSMSLRGTTYYISDLLWFKQEGVTGGGTTTTSSYFSPLVIENAASVTRATWTSDGNTCTSWTGSAASGFSAASGGSFTFMYHDASSPTDDTPSTSDTFYYCLDTTNTRVYLGTSQSYDSGTLLSAYSRNSDITNAYTYQYQFLSGAQTNGNRYCLASYTGSGTAATPDLVQCQKLTYSLSGSAYAKLYPMFDPPQYFPSSNQGGSANVITYALSGTQWNPYAYTTTNSA